MEVVTHTREIGKAKMFKLNTQNQIVKELITFADNLVWTNIQTQKEIALEH